MLVIMTTSLTQFGIKLSIMSSIRHHNRIVHTSSMVKMTQLHQSQQCYLTLVTLTGKTKVMKRLTDSMHVIINYIQ